MRPLTTFEHATLTAEDFCHPHDFDWLIEQNFSCFSIVRKAKQWQLNVRHYLGVIGLPSGQPLEILPKISQCADIPTTRHWVQTMLADIWHTLPNTPLPSLANQHILPNINADLALSTWLYQHFVARLSQYQPNQHYQNIEQNQNYLQGKLLVKQQLQHNSHQAHKFFSQYDTFAATTASNRIIKTALQLFATLQIGQPAALVNAQFWHTIEPLIPSQYAQFFAQSQSELHLLSPAQRQVTEPLLILSQWLLKLQQPLPSFAPNQLQLTFLINMHTAFEKWVSCCIARQFAADFTALLQRSQPLVLAENGDTLLSIKPDIVLKRGADTIVADVKWKSISRISEIGLADIYQLLTYASECKARQAWLIVPSLGGEPMTKNLAQPMNFAQPKTAQLMLVPFDVTQAKLLLCH